MPSCRGSSQPKNWTCISYVSCIGRRFLYHWATWEAPRTSHRSINNCYGPKQKVQFGCIFRCYSCRLVKQMEGCPTRGESQAHSEWSFYSLKPSTGGLHLPPPWMPGNWRTLWGSGHVVGAWTNSFFMLGGRFGALLFAVDPVDILCPNWDYLGEIVCRGEQLSPLPTRNRWVHFPRRALWLLFHSKEKVLHTPLPF